MTLKVIDQREVLAKDFKIYGDYDNPLFLAKDVANNLKNRAIKIQSIASKSAFDIGKELKEANEELANHGNGCFEKWYRSLGFKTTKAYEYINHYNFVSSQNEESKIKMFESLPIGLQKQVSNPTAKQEVVQSVLSGDVKTVKEVEELKRQLKQKDEQIFNQSKTIEQLSNQEPEIREIEVEKLKIRPKQSLGLLTNNNEYWFLTEDGLYEVLMQLSKG